MGYFAYAYVLDAEEDHRGLALTRSVYEADLSGTGGSALFSWDRGDRPTGMFEYASGTLFCSQRLRLLEGYPFSWHANPSDEYQMEEGFWPRSENDPVLFHLLLPTGFVPRPNRPLQQPSRPNVCRFGDRLVVSYGARGGTDIKFWIERLSHDESFNDFVLDRVLESSKSTSAKIEFEINLGLLKVKFAGD